MRYVSIILLAFTLTACSANSQFALLTLTDHAVRAEQQRQQNLAAEDELHKKYEAEQYRLKQLSQLNEAGKCKQGKVLLPEWKTPDR